MCPLCKASEYKLVFGDVDITTCSIVKCVCCSHLYTKNEKQGSNNVYDNGTYQLVNKKENFFTRILSWENKRILKKINTHSAKKGHLLDFGCGKGKFAAAAVAKGWQVKCVETSSSRAAFAKEVYQLDVNTAIYSHGKIFGENFNTITLFHVLEHLENPKKILAELVNHNLAKNGLLVVEVPNPESWQARIAGKKWHHWDLRHHISHFTSAQLDQIAASLDLIPVSASYMSIHLGVVGMCDSLLKKSGYNSHIIWDLKTKRSLRFIISILLILPFAFLLEFTSILFSKGGVIRKYYRKKN